MKGMSRVKNELFTRSGHLFESFVGTILSDLIDNSAQSKSLGRLDQLGIDAYAWKHANGSLETVIQCKGFELLEYGEDQQTQCLKEVEKYKKKGLNTREYWLVINRPIKERKMRDDLNQRLVELENSGKADRAIILDLERFLSKLGDLASSRIVEWSKLKRSELFKYYAERMEVVDYISPVPFQKQTQLLDPVQHMLNNVKNFYRELPKHQTGKYRAPPRYLLTSGFGFGKTSALHDLGKQWVESGANLVYAPAPLLDNRAFTNSAGLADAILLFLIPEDCDPNESTRLLLRDAVRSNLANSTDWLLMIDGLDESPWAHKANSLAGLWGSIRDLGVPAVLTAREELVDSRPSEFAHDPIRNLPAFERLELLNWSDDLVLLFVDGYSTRKGAEIPQAFQEFRDLIETGQYMDVYGDIPKRPLFLSMLCTDAWAGQEPSRELHRLYGQYFRRKLQIDRVQSSAGGVSTRPSAIVDAFGVDETAERLMTIMESVTWKMVDQDTPTDEIEDPPHLLQQDTIEEDTLRNIASGHGVDGIQLEDLLMHSLLQPAGRDPRTRQRLVRFAHRSYQDWFLARRIAREEPENSVRIPPSAARFLVPMLTDLKQGLGLP